MKLGGDCHEQKTQIPIYAGQKIESSGMIIFRVENGKIVEEREDFDWLGMMRQLGMELKPKEVK